MDLSSSMMTFGVRQLGAMLGETATRQAVGAGLQLLQQSAEAARAVLPGESGLEWRELANKLAAFEHFQQTPAWPGMAPGDDASLTEQLRHAAAFDTYRRVWTIEGLGYAHGESAWAVQRVPRWLLAEDGLEGLPAGVMIPLHTGAGLSFAGRLLAMEESRSPAGLARWIARCEENARPGYGGILVEALGLVARNLYPHRVWRLGEQLAALDPVLSEYFWHGVGRGLYFVPTHALPYSGAHGRAFEKAWREPADEPGRRNATAGLTWALALVNIRDPEVLAEVLRRHGGEIGSPEAFANGIASAMLVWYDIVGLDSHLADFLAYRPQPSHPALAALWRGLVLQPCEEAFQHTYPQLRQSGGPAALFRCRLPLGKGGFGP